MGYQKSLVIYGFSVVGITFLTQIYVKISVILVSGSRLVINTRQYIYQWSMMQNNSNTLSIQF